MIGNVLCCWDDELMLVNMNIYLHFSITCQSWDGGCCCNSSLWVLVPCAQINLFSAVNYGMICRWYNSSHVSGHFALLWHNNVLDGVSNHQPHECLLTRSFGRRSKKTSQLRVTGLCAGNSPETGEFPAQMASNAENVSIRWRHHGIINTTHIG